MRKDIMNHNVKFKKELLQLPRLMWHHDSRFRMQWDLFVMVLALYNCIMIPYNVAFQGQATDEASVGAWVESFVDRVIDVLFLTDIVLNFRTTYVNPKTNLEVVSASRIACNYFSSRRFWIDVLASIPFEMFMQLSETPSAQGDAAGTQIQILGLLKMVRLLRLGRIISYMKVRSGMKVGFKLLQLLSGILLLVHWLGCIWFLLVNTPEQDWLPPKDLDAQETDFFVIPTYEQYFLVVYQAMLLIMGNESGPRNLGQTIFSALVVFTGAIVTAFIFGNMAALMSTINKKENLLNEQLDMVQQTMRSIKLPEEIQDKVMSYFQYITETPDVHLDLDKFFNLLGPKLKQVILFHLHSEVITSIDILQGLSEIELNFIVVNLKNVLFLPGDVVIRQGEEAETMFFLTKGKADVQITKYILDQEYLETVTKNGGRRSSQKLMAEEIGALLGGSALRNGGDATDQVDGSSPTTSLLQKRFAFLDKSRTFFLVKTFSHAREAEEDAKADDLKSSEVDEEDDGGQLKGMTQRVYNITQLEKGSFFGEIGLITQLKRTATVTSADYCTLAEMKKAALKQAKRQYPSVYQNLRNHLCTY